MLKNKAGCSYSSFFVTRYYKEVNTSTKAFLWCFRGAGSICRRGQKVLGLSGIWRQIFYYFIEHGEISGIGHSRGFSLALYGFWLTRSMTRQTQFLYKFCILLSRTSVEVGFYELLHGKSLFYLQPKYYCRNFSFPARRLIVLIHLYCPGQNGRTTAY